LKDIGSSTAGSLVGTGDEHLAWSAYSALGISHRRVEILRFLLSRERTSVSQVMAEFGLTRNGVLGHLRAMQQGGLISVSRTTHPRGAGPISYWKADTEAVFELMEGLQLHVLSVS